MLARVNGAPVMVFVDRSDADHFRERLAVGSGVVAGVHQAQDFRRFDAPVFASGEASAQVAGVHQALDSGNAHTQYRRDLLRRQVRLR